MSKIGYISDQKADGLINSLEMEFIAVPKTVDFRLFLRNLIRDDYAVLFVSESLYLRHEKIIKTYDSSFEVAIIVLASIGEYDNVGKKRMKEMIEEAIGVKV